MFIVVMLLFICQTAAVFHVGDVVRKLRVERGLSLEELAQLADVNKMTLSGLERGENYRRDTLEKVAAALQKSVAELFAPLSNVEPGEIDVSDYTPGDIPVIGEGEASPQGELFWTDEGTLRSDVEGRISRPRDVRDPRAYGVKVRGDSMLPIYKPGMILIVSPNTPPGEGDEVYAMLLSGERLIKILHRTDEGYVLESANPAYPPRFVKKSEIGAVHPVLYARRKR